MKLRYNPVYTFQLAELLMRSRGKGGSAEYGFDNDENLITENKCFSPEANDKSNDTNYFLVLMI